MAMGRPTVVTSACAAVLTARQGVELETADDALQTLPPRCSPSWTRSAAMASGDLLAPASLRTMRGRRGWRGWTTCLRAPIRRACRRRDRRRCGTLPPLRRARDERAGRTRHDGVASDGVQCRHRSRLEARAASCRRRARCRSGDSLADRRIHRRHLGALGNLRARLPDRPHCACTDLDAAACAGRARPQTRCFGPRAARLRWRGLARRLCRRGAGREAARAWSRPSGPR